MKHHYIIAIYPTNLPDLEIECYNCSKVSLPGGINPSNEIKIFDTWEAAQIVFEQHKKFNKVVAKFENSELCVVYNQNK